MSTTTTPDPATPFSAAEEPCCPNLPFGHPHDYVLDDDGKWKCRHCYEPHPHNLDSPGLGALATIASRLRAALHSSVEERVNDPDTVEDQDGHRITVADDGDGHTVLVVDGADVSLDDRDVASLCARLLWRTIRGREHGPFRLWAAHELLRNEGPEAW